MYRCVGIPTLHSLARNCKPVDWPTTHRERGIKQCLLYADHDKNYSTPKHVTQEKSLTDNSNTVRYSTVALSRFEKQWRVARTRHGEPNQQWALEGVVPAAYGKDGQEVPEHDPEPPENQHCQHLLLVVKIAIRPAIQDSTCLPLGLGETTKQLRVPLLPHPTGARLTSFRNFHQRAAGGQGVCSWALKRVKRGVQQHPEEPQDPPENPKKKHTYRPPFQLLVFSMPPMERHGEYNTKGGRIQRLGDT